MFFNRINTFFKHAFILFAWIIIFLYFVISYAHEYTVEKDDLSCILYSFIKSRILVEWLNICVKLLVLNTIIQYISIYFNLKPVCKLPRSNEELSENAISASGFDSINQKLVPWFTYQFKAQNHELDYWKGHY